MDETKRQILADAGADVEGAMERFMNNDKLYWRFLDNFKKNPYLHDLEEALSQKDWERSLEISHNLKGMTGSLGFTQLYEMFITQVKLLREARNDEAAALMNDIMAEHRRIMDHISDLP